MPVRRQTLRSCACLPMLLALAGLLPACGAATPTLSTSTSPPASISRTAEEATEPPPEKSDLPDGKYRTELTTEKLQKLGSDDLTSAGVWTLTVASGTYQVDCTDVDDREFDCGNTGSAHRKSPTVEMGYIYGKAPTVWFKHDPERLSKVNGCQPAVDRCGPVGGYHLDWQLVPTGLKFSRYVGLGDEMGPAPASWVAQPWTKIS